MGTYTLPAHSAMFYGFLPHVFSPEPLYNRYCQQLWRITHRNVHVKPLVTFPLGNGSVISNFQRRGYFTVGVAAMDWFRDAPSLQEGFERFEVTGTGARRQNERLFRLIEKHAAHQPCFAFLNYGETHSPFRYEGMEESGGAIDTQFSLSRLFNQQGVWKDEWQFDETAYRRQVACAEYLDRQMADVIDFIRRRGRPTTVIVCSDHGECFGENGMYGHAFYHERVMEVPMLIFRLNAPPHATPEASVWAKAS
jgi:arylsulfatase A-like enzyme